MLGGSLRAQQPVFSQFYSAGLYLNPALAGLEKDITLGMNYRSQWASVDIPFSTFQISYIHPLIKPGGRPKHVGGIGASLLNDVTGAANEFRQTGFMVTGAYNFHLNGIGTNIIAVGMQGGLFQKQIDPSAFQWSSQYDNLLGYDQSTPPPNFLETDQRFYPVLNAGVTWMVRLKERFSRKEFSFYQGFSVASLNRPNTAVFDTGTEKAPVAFRIHGGLDIFLTRQFSVSPHYLLQKEGTFYQTNLGAYVKYYLGDRIDEAPTILMLGGWYRLGDAAILSGGMEIHHWRLFFSYDRNTGSMSRYFGPAPSYEISLQFRLKRTMGIKRYSTPMI
jgi:type IX secretion system PorP/SprF family membrane protein